MRPLNDRRAFALTVSQQRSVSWLDIQDEPWE